MSEFIVTVNGAKKDIRFFDGNEIFINNVKHQYELLKLSSDSYLLKLDNTFYEIPSVINNNGKSLITAGSENFEVVVRSYLQEKAAGIIEQKNKSLHGMEVRAPMPGMIIKIKTTEGSGVEHGDAVLILEAMKMENEVRTPSGGILKKIYVREGETVEKGTTLFLIE